MQAEFLAEELAEVGRIFHFRDEKVQVFIDKHPDTLPLLRMTHTAMTRHFSSHVRRIDLEAAGMWGDGTGNELFVLIRCDLEADAAVEMLDDFDHRWWSFASQLEDWPIYIEVEYAGV